MKIKQLDLFCTETQNNILEFPVKNDSETELSIWKVKETDRHHFLIAMPFHQINPSAMPCVCLRAVKSVDDFTIGIVLRRTKPWIDNCYNYQLGPTSLKDLAELLATPIGSKPQNMCTCETDRIYRILSESYNDLLKDLGLKEEK